MEVKDVVSLDKDYDVNEIMGNLVYALNDDNFTFLAIKDRFKENDKFNLIKVFLFLLRKSIAVQYLKRELI
ncbi:E1-E2 family cation-transporting ATPase domain protein [[Clostridium] sordellii ATCC 9714]|nr:E1-E2 family cation-transporting ATPase domain protein [[Clostridium] sordellii ATCC 9714] [Paeniclostridium sordellii ATCC 9714]